MPVFKRPDGDLVTDEAPVRRMIPYLMLGRNESVVYHDQIMDLTRAKPWLKVYNRHHKQAATLFHLLMFAFGRGLNARPGMNRFISGGRIYQRKGTQISFAAKKRLLDNSPLVTVKLPFTAEESFTDCVRRIVDSIDNARGDGISMVDKELKLALALPGVMLRVVMALLRLLDRVNLLPGAMIDTDPMYASMFVANLGSIGLDRTYHHLYEYGTISLFASLGTPKKMLFVGPDDQPVVREGIEVRWAFDERINDGFYCAASMRVAQRIVEDPERYLGDPKAGADKSPAEAGEAAAE
jgi:hypothetical protein